MGSQEEFAALHQPGNPLILYNIWDAGSAAVVASAGARAIATGSLALAGAQGFDDGEQLPFADLLASVGQIASAISLPLTVDFEAGYADDLEQLSKNAQALRGAGAVGCNLEDRLIGQEGLRDPAEQAERIVCVREAGLFVNARTDLFLSLLAAGEDPNQHELLGDALARAEIYAQAGTGCFFVPALSDPVLIRELCGQVALPVNVLRLGEMPTNSELAALGVGRISYGGMPWRNAMQDVAEAARQAFSLRP